MKQSLPSSKAMPDIATAAQKHPQSRESALRRLIGPLAARAVSAAIAVGAMASPAVAPAAPASGNASPEPLRISISASAAIGEFVCGEDVVIDATLRNASRQAFIVDDYGPYAENRIFAYVRNVDSERLLMPRTGAPATLVEEAEIAPGAAKTFRIPLGRAYDLTKPGRYHATIVATDGHGSASSQMVSFSVVSGLELRSETRAFGMDGGRIRKFSLVYWTRNQGETLFLRITDPSRDGAIVGFANLGSLVRVADPSLSFAQDGSLVIVHQISRDRFARTTLNVTGDTPTLLSRDSNLLDAGAVAGEMSARLVAERIEERDAEKKEGRPGFFERRRQRTRTQLPPPTGTSESDAKK